MRGVFVACIDLTASIAIASGIAMIAGGILLLRGPMISAIILIALCGWIVIGAVAWIVRSICAAMLAAWRFAFEGAERRFRRLRPWYRG